MFQWRFFKLYFILLLMQLTVKTINYFTSMVVTCLDTKYHYQINLVSVLCEHYLSSFQKKDWL